MFTDLSHQSRRSLPRDRVASKVAVHEDCDLVNMFRSLKSQRHFGLSHQISRCRFQWTKSNSRGSLILWAKCFAVSARFNLSWAKNESLIQADLYLLAFPLFKIGLPLPSNTSLSCSFFRGVLTVFRIRRASCFTDDKFCMSQVKFSVQVLSSLISPNF